MINECVRLCACLDWGGGLPILCECLLVRTYHPQDGGGQPPADIFLAKKYISVTKVYCILNFREANVFDVYTIYILTHSIVKQYVAVNTSDTSTSITQTTSNRDTFDCCWKTFCGGTPSPSSFFYITAHYAIPRLKFCSSNPRCVLTLNT